MLFVPKVGLAVGRQDARTINDRCRVVEVTVGIKFGETADDDRITASGLL